MKDRKKCLPFARYFFHVFLIAKVPIVKINRWNLNFDSLEPWRKIFIPETWCKIDNLRIIEGRLRRNLYRFLISATVLRAKERSKRKRRKSHSSPAGRVIDRGDEARSAICTRDRSLQRISRMDENGGSCACVRARTHARVGARRVCRYMRDTSASRCVCGSIPDLDVVAEKKNTTRKKKISEDYPDLVRARSLFVRYHTFFFLLLSLSPPSYPSPPLSPYLSPPFSLSLPVIDNFARTFAQLLNRIDIWKLERFRSLSSSCSCNTLVNARRYFA